MTSLSFIILKDMATYRFKRKIYAAPAVGFLTKLTGIGKGGNFAKAFNVGKAGEGMSAAARTWEATKGGGKLDGGAPATGPVAEGALLGPSLTGNVGID